MVGGYVSVSLDPTSLLLHHRGTQVHHSVAGVVEDRY